MKFGYIGIVVEDSEKSLKFYTNYLGLTESRRGKTKNGSWIMLEDSATGQKFFLISLNANSPLKPKDNKKQGMVNMGFVVANVKETFEKLVADGVPAVIEPYTDGPSWASYVEDPDGNKIEIYSSE